MLVVLFEVQPKRDRRDDYLDIAKYLKPKLEAMDGFIAIERFASRRTEGRLLSVSTWRDEKAVISWRAQSEHHQAQAKGRAEIFEDYHLRVGAVTRDSEPSDAAALASSLAAARQGPNETAKADAKAASITEWVPPEDVRSQLAIEDVPARFGLKASADGLVGHEVFESLHHPGKLLLLVTWRDIEAAENWTPRSPETGALRHRQIRVIRDYGMTDRGEAPQVFPEIAGARDTAAR